MGGNGKRRLELVLGRHTLQTLFNFVSVLNTTAKLYDPVLSDTKDC